MLVILKTAVEFIRFIVLKATPITWMGIPLTAIFLFFKKENQDTKVFRYLILYLFITAIMFILLFSIAQGRNSPHYVMSSYISLDAIAALGWCMSIEWLGNKWKATGNVQIWAV